MTESPQKLERNLSNRHVQLIAIGGAIGTGLFLGAGKTIHLAGPSLLLVYLIVGIVIFFMMRALGELLLSNTEFNSFADIASEYIGPWAGFFVGWTYWLCWIVTGMAEITAVATYVSYWFPNFPNWISALLCVLFLVALNSLTVKAFGEIEFWFSIIKIVTILALIVVGIVLILNKFQATSTSTASVSNLWQHGGFFPTGFKGFLLAFQMAVFSFAGVELIGVTAAETKDPEKTIPRAINQIPLRIILFYVGALFVIMSIVPWNQIDPDKSPFVTLFMYAGIPAAVAIINFVVLTAAASSCNSGIFSTSRMLYGLAKHKRAPKIFNKLSASNIPSISLYFSSAVLLIGVLLNYFIKNAITVFTIVTSISSLLFVFIWGMIVVAFIRYRKNHAALAKKSIFKMPGASFMPVLIILFFIGVIIMLAVAPDTRISIICGSLWFVILFLIYRFAHKKTV
ncbi:amino acid permease [Brochothrix campestris]